MISTMSDKPRRFISLDELAEELAISKPLATTLIRSGEIPAIQIGGRGIWRIERTKLEAYVQRQYDAARAKIADEPLGEHNSDDGH